MALALLALEPSLEGIHDGFDGGGVTQPGPGEPEGDEAGPVVVVVLVLPDPVHDHLCSRPGQQVQQLG